VRSYPRLSSIACRTILRARLQWTGLAVAALVFLVVIHKLEYFFSARLLGARIQAFSWELLIAMLVMESLFGTAGLIAAPIYYAYVKRELREARLI
jgi:predicted PurR-regulated permease PerM